VKNGDSAEALIWVAPRMADAREGRFRSVGKHGVASPTQTRPHFSHGSLELAAASRWQGASVSLGRRSVCEFDASEELFFGSSSSPLTFNERLDRSVDSIWTAFFAFVSTRDAVRISHVLIATSSGWADCLLRCNDESRRRDRGRSLFDPGCCERHGPLSTAAYRCCVSLRAVSVRV